METSLLRKRTQNLCGVISGRNVEITEGQSASVKNIRLENIREENCNKSSISGYRVFNMVVLANVLRLLGCNSCNSSKRKGCTSLLNMHCASWGWQHSFCSSFKNSFNEIYWQRSRGSQDVLWYYGHACTSRAKWLPPL